MSYSIVGNNKTPVFFLAWYEVCIDEDEDEYADIEGETVDEQDIFARRAIVPKIQIQQQLQLFSIITLQLLNGIGIITMA